MVPIVLVLTVCDQRRIPLPFSFISVRIPNWTLPVSQQAKAGFKSICLCPLTELNHWPQAVVQSPQSLLIHILLHCNVAHESWESRLSSPLAVSQLRSENRNRFPPESSVLSANISSGAPNLSAAWQLRPLASRSSSQTCRCLFCYSSGEPFDVIEIAVFISVKNVCTP